MSRPRRARRDPGGVLGGLCGGLLLAAGSSAAVPPPAAVAPPAAAGAPVSTADSPLISTATRATTTDGDPQLVSLSLRDADLAEVLRSFARLGDFNLLIQPGVEGKVTVELKNVPWPRALDAILGLQGLGMEITRGTLYVAPREVLLEQARWRSEWARGSTEPTVRLRSRAPGSVSTGSASTRAVSKGSAGRDSGWKTVEGRLDHLAGARFVVLLEDGGFLEGEERAWVTDEGALRLRASAQRLPRLRRLAVVLDQPETASLDDEALALRAAEAWSRAD